MNPKSSVPIPDSYWVRPGELLAGEYPGNPRSDRTKARLEAFIRAGIRTFIDLTEPADGLEPYEPLLDTLARDAQVALRYYRYGIRDGNIPPAALMSRILERIRAEIVNGRPAYVHCWGGIGRTGTVIGCWLIEQGQTPAEALRHIETLRAHVPDSFKSSPENPKQCQFVHEWRATSTGHDTTRSWRRTANEPKRRSSDECRRDRFRGCLVGGAVGDALGAPVEFHSIRQIRARYGPAGIADYDVAYGRRGAITDDTQMTLFTAEGLLRANVRGNERGIGYPPTVIYRSYLRWLHTQRECSRSLDDTALDGWLIGVQALHARRAPGNTCLSALCGGTMGMMDEPLNNSKGCGGVMRVAPVGLLASDVETAFTLGCEAAAITHGHPSGYYSAGCMAAIVRHLLDGRPLIDAIERTLCMMTDAAGAGHEECAAAIRQAVELAQNANVQPSPETVERLGGGWVGEEALAIALYCALQAENDFAKGVLLAVNHSGDSDSTGAIAGNILGLIVGLEAIPRKWRDELELAEVIAAVADDLWTGFDDGKSWRDRYPG